MALFQPFPNYVWNLSVAIALENGGRIGEVMDMIEPLRAKAEAGEDAGTADFMAEWVRMGDKLAGLAEEDLEKGRGFSAGDKLKRASIYYLTGERMQARGSAGREETYAKALDSFRRGTELAADPVERVEIGYEGKTIVGLFHRAPVEGPAPCVLYCNGLDSMKEMLWLGGFAQALAKRGIHTLCVDQPGTGEALRLQGLPATPYSERWASQWVDWLERQPQVDKSRIGMTGISLGGHFAPRAVAYESRFASGAAWGANHNWREVQDRRMAREGENPVPHYWAHVYWVFGAADHADFLEKTKDMNLNGHMDRIKVPFLVTHGAKDRQIDVAYAHQSYDQLINSPRRELKIFTAREGGVEHVGADNMSFGKDYIADWFAETLGGLTQMSFASVAHVPTGRSRRYLQQLCKHWDHNLEVEFTAERGTIVFPRDARGADWPADGRITLIAQATSLECRVEASAPGQLEGLKGTVSRHLDRFAFREAPLVFDWQDQ